MEVVRTVVYRRNGNGSVRVQIAIFAVGCGKQGPSFAEVVHQRDVILRILGSGHHFVAPLVYQEDGGVGFFLGRSHFFEKMADAGKTLSADRLGWPADVIQVEVSFVVSQAEHAAHYGRRSLAEASGRLQYGAVCLHQSPRLSVVAEGEGFRRVLLRLPAAPQAAYQCHQAPSEDVVYRVCLHVSTSKYSVYKDSESRKQKNKLACFFAETNLILSKDSERREQRQMKNAVFQFDYAEPPLIILKFKDACPSSPR